MGHGSKKIIYEVYGDYIEGLEEDFWQILEYYGRDFAQPKTKASTTMMEYQTGQAFVVPYQLPALLLPEQNKAPISPQNLHGESFSESRGNKKGILRIPF